MSAENSDEKLIASAGHRIAAIGVDTGFYIVTFGIGWFIWNLVTMAKGQSPGKQILKVRVLNEVTMQPANWGHMAIRQYLIPLLASLFWMIPYYTLVGTGFEGANSFTLMMIVLSFLVYLSVVIIDFVWLFGSNHRRLVDYLSKTIVVNESVQ